MQNNWRPRQSSKEQAPNFTVKPIEVLWNTRRDEVFAEIAKLLNVAYADATTPEWFNKHMKALHILKSRLTEEEQSALDHEVIRLAEQGYPEEQKRRSALVPMSIVTIVPILYSRCAERYSRIRLETAAQNNWLEMGMLSITFAIRTTPDGQLAIEL